MDRVGRDPNRLACSFQGQNWTYAEFARLIEAETRRWAEVVRFAGLKPR
mgnify:CR=1 FL=1